MRLLAATLTLDMMQACWLCLRSSQPRVFAFPCRRSSKEGGLSLTHDLTPLRHLTSLVLEARQAVSLSDTVRYIPCRDAAGFRARDGCLAGPPWLPCNLWYDAAAL